MNNPFYAFYVIQDSNKEEIWWVNTDNKDDAWESFWEANEEHGFVDLSEFRDDKEERWETAEDFLQEQGYRCIDVELYPVGTGRVVEDLLAAVEASIGALNGLAIGAGISMPRFTANSRLPGTGRRRNSVCWLWLLLA